MIAHDLTQLSAALTYYTVLSLLPALIVVVALLGIVGLSADTVHSLLDTLGELGAPWAAQFVSDVLDSVLASENSGVVLIVSLLVALWAASAYVGSFMAASDRIYEIARPAALLDRPPAARRPGAAAPRAALGDGGGRRAGRPHRRLGRPTPPASAPARCTSGPGSSGRCSSSWGCCSSPLLYKFTPSRRQPHLWWLLPGAVVGVALWIAGSAGFSFYLDNFASYNRVYGTLAPAVAFLVWAWLMNLALLVGVEVNREVELRRAGGSDLPGADASGPARGRAAGPAGERIIGVHANRRAPARLPPPVTPCPS